MPMTKEQILTEVLTLKPEERESLAEQIWLSVEGANEAEIDAAWAEEIECRIDALESGKIEAVPAEQTLQRLAEKYRR